MRVLDWIHLAQNWNCWLAFVNTIINFWSYKMLEISLIADSTIGFRKKDFASLLLPIFINIIHEIYVSVYLVFS